MQLQLIRSKPEDYCEVEKLLLYLHNKHATQYPGFYNKVDVFYSQDEYNKIIKKNNTIIILVKKSDLTVGLLWAERKEKPENKFLKARKEIWLEGIIVSEDHRNLGIGKMLLEELIKIGKKDKVDSIELMVWSKNDEAINLYNKYFTQRAMIMTHSLQGIE